MNFKKNKLLPGDKFGKWEVIAYYPDKKPGNHYECACSCGVIAIKAATELRAGRSTRCRDCMHSYLHNPEKQIGKRFGRWKVIAFIGVHRKLHRFLCLCDCGTEKMHCLSYLRCGKSKQCQVCHNRENARNNRKHGKYNNRTYKIWCAMIQRCKNPNSTSYKWYGLRGINICNRWLKFENFYDDMGEAPEGLTLDRINNDGDYCKKNCRWVTHKENCNNRTKRKSIPTRID